MAALLWLIVSLILSAGGSENHHVRHERTRYLVVGARHFADDEGGGLSFNSADKNWEWENRVGAPRDPESAAKTPRPLFSWDSPSNESPAVARMNYPGNISAAKPTAWHGSKKWKPFLKRVPPPKSTTASRAGHTKKAYIAFRNSYVYKAEPTEVVKPKKVIRIVYGDKRKGKGKGNRPFHVAGHPCNNPGGCRLRKMQTTSNDVEYFPKGIDNWQVEAQRRKNKPKYQKTKDRNFGSVSTKPPPSGPCLTAQEKCEQICIEEGGRSLCSCYPGFHLVNGTRCVDVDECALNNGGCEGICVNIVGSRRCLCPEGFRLSSANGECTDINECLLRNGHGPCQDTCTNTRGSYYCSCDGLEGTVLSSDKHTCREVDDCKSGVAGCSHSCISTFGRSFCTCPDGYELGDDWKTCHDVDECSDPQNYDVHCEYGCVNTLGSYRCEPGEILRGRKWQTRLFGLTHN